MSNFTIDRYDFCNDKFTEINADGVRYIDVDSVLAVIGFDNLCSEELVKILNDDLVVSKGCKVFLFEDGKAHLCLLDEFVPLWLAKVLITDDLRSKCPIAAEKMIKYQIHVKSVLFDKVLDSNKIDRESIKAYAHQSFIDRINKRYGIGFLLGAYSAVFNVDELQLIKYGVKHFDIKKLSELESIIDGLSLLGFSRDDIIKQLKRKYVHIGNRMPCELSITQYLEIIGMDMNTKEFLKLEDKAFKIAKTEKIKLDTVPNPIFGEENIYPRWILEKVFEEA